MWKKPKVLVTTLRAIFIPSNQVACDRISCCW